MKRLIELTLRGASSADNQQPWAFHWNRKCLRVRESIRGFETTDPGRFLNAVNLGMVAEVIEIAASKLTPGLSPVFEFCDPAQELGMDVRFEHSPNRDVDPLFEALEARWCDRRDYAGEVPDEVLRASARELDSGLGLHAAGHGGPINGLDHHYWGKVFTGDRVCAAEMYRWMRFSRRDAERTRDGMHWTTITESWAMSRLIRALLRPDFRGDPIRWCAKKLFVGPHRRATSTQGEVPETSGRRNAALGSFCCLTVGSSATANTVIKAGRSVIRVWLRLTLDGYSYQPKLTLPLLFFDRENNSSSRIQSLVSDSEIRQAMSTCANSFGYDMSQQPVWMFRSGLPSARRHHATLRKPIDEVLDIAHDAVDGS